MPLTEVGREQAGRRGRAWLADGVRFDCIVASPLLRARETAEIIGTLLNLPVEIDPDWQERDNGMLAGLSRADAAMRYPRPCFRNPYEPMCQTGESETQVYGRAARALEKLIRRAAGHSLIVAHGNILNAAMRNIAGALLSINDQGIWFTFGDTGYARTSYEPACHRWFLHEFHSE